MDIKRVETLTDEIYEKYKNYGVNRKEILEKMKKLVLEFKVPESEAVKTMENYIRREYVPKDEGVQFTKIGDIKESGKWVSVKAKVVQLWEPGSPSIAQTGLIGDDTGVIRFLVWTKANKPSVEEGKSYAFKNVVVDEYAGNIRLNVTRYSEIEEIDEEIEVAPISQAKEDVEVVGVLVAVQQNSGLIQRCSVEGCGRVVKSGICPVHGKTEWYDDLRVKGVLDDGERTYEVIIDEEGVKFLTGIDLERAKKIAEENLDRGAVLSELKRRLLGKYLRVTGRMTPRYLIASSVEFYRPDIGEEIEKLLAELEEG